VHWQHLTSARHAESFGEVGKDLSPPGAEVGGLQATTAAILQYLYPLVYNIMVINFVISVLIQAFDAVRLACKEEMSEVRAQRQASTLLHATRYCLCQDARRKGIWSQYMLCS
jgi:hypothetical protein